MAWGAIPVAGLIEIASLYIGAMMSLSFNVSRLGSFSHNVENWKNKLRFLRLSSGDWKWSAVAGTDWVETQ